MLLQFVGVADVAAASDTSSAAAPPTSSPKPNASRKSSAVALPPCTSTSSRIELVHAARRALALGGDLRVAGGVDRVALLLLLGLLALGLLLLLELLRLERLQIEVAARCPPAPEEPLPPPPPALAQEVRERLQRVVGPLLGERVEGLEIAGAIWSM